MKSISDRRMDRSDDVSSAINTETMASVVSTPGEEKEMFS